MKLLIVTQAVDSEDPVLGFFVRWIEEIAKHTALIEVICLRKGKYHLPENVRVHSLGKERGAVSRITYVRRFISLAWKLRHDYDQVFVHMNEEYILIAGWLWNVLGKHVYLWRNHYAGSWRTGIAVTFCRKVFCTSEYSYTAKYAKTTLMPVGIDTTVFFPDTRIKRMPRSILYLGRMAPSKRAEILIDALAQLAKEEIDFTADFYGSPLPENQMYYQGLKDKVHGLNLDGQVAFHAGIPNNKTPDIYRGHEIFVNTSPSGMLDKTIFEAAACGAMVLAASLDWSKRAGQDLAFVDAPTLASRLAASLEEGQPQRSERLQALVEANSLTRLGTAVVQAM
jgi:glycosyltransferase involved in cell wall biosynthesis